jgi:hypothetical protein
MRNPRKAELLVSVGEESVEEVGVEVDPLCVVNLCERFNQSQIVSSVSMTLGFWLSTKLHGPSKQKFTQYMVVCIRDLFSSTSDSGL